MTSNSEYIETLGFVTDETRLTFSYLPDSENAPIAILINEYQALLDMDDLVRATNFLIRCAEDLGRRANTPSIKSSSSEVQEGGQ